MRFRREGDEEEPAPATSVVAGAESDHEEPRPLTLNEKLQQRIDEKLTSLPSSPDQVEFVAEDLNGVNPLVALSGGLLYSAMAAGAWAATSFAAEWFSSHPPPEEVYIAARATVVVRTVVVGLTSMFAGIAGVTALGMFGLAARVAVGVVSGELDPSKRPEGADDGSLGEGVDAALDALLPREWRRK